MSGGTEEELLMTAMIAPSVRATSNKTQIAEDLR